jgi:hypothetical protein
MKIIQCSISGKKFSFADQEEDLRRKLGVDGHPTIAPEFRFRHLAAFWPHWNLHSRTCSSSGQRIISTFSDKCPYPVWHHKYWIENADPPSADLNRSELIFPQLWELFKQCPIPHNIGAGNENCEYTDDWWYSKNCYLCHSGLNCEDLRYCYRVINLKDCQFCVFSFDCELCIDLINCFNCFEVLHSFNCRNCQNSAFLYDCRNCTNCLFCSNLRNKQYCIGNQQLSQKEYTTERDMWDFSSQKIYQAARENFTEMLLSRAWHRAAFIDNCENSSGNYLERDKNCQNCFFMAESEDCVNSLRNHRIKDQLDSVGNFDAELIYLSTLTQDNCYDIKFCFSQNRCRFMEYCGYCTQCENCFGCCGLVGKQYCIFNKAYTEAEYFDRRSKLISAMQTAGEYGRFFPGKFAPNPYDESFAAVHFPLSQAGQSESGFRKSENTPRKNEDFCSPTQIPDSSAQTDSSLSRNIFWDEQASRPFQIQAADIAYSKKMKIPYPNRYYSIRLQDNFQLMSFCGSLRNTTCAKSGEPIHTTWPEDFDSRILAEDEYLHQIM